MYHKRRYLDVLESISPLLFCEVLLSAYLHVCVSGLWRTWINHMSKLHQISGVCFLIAVVRHSFDDKCSKLCRLLPVLLTASCSHKHRRRQWGVQVCSQWLTKERHWKRSLMSTITLFIASFRVIQVYVVAEKMYCRQAYWCCLPTMSVRLSLSVGLSQHGPAAANPLLHRFAAVCPAGRRSIDCCTAGAQQRPANVDSATLSAFVGSWTQICSYCCRTKPVLQSLLLMKRTSQRVCGECGYVYFDYFHLTVTAYIQIQAFKNNRTGVYDMCWMCKLKVNQRQ